MNVNAFMFSYVEPSFVTRLGTIDPIQGTDVQAYRDNIKPVGKLYREIFGKYFPAITLVEVKGLYNRDCMVEVSEMAIID